MRIFLLSHEPLYPPTGGGSSEAVFLVKELISRGHQVTFIGPLHDSMTSENLESLMGVDIVSFKSFKMGRYAKLRTLKYLLYPFFLSQHIECALRSKNCDLIIGQHSISSVAAGWVGLRKEIPVVMNFLDFLTGFMDTWPEHLMPKPFLYFLKRFELSLPMRFRASGVLCISDALRHRFQSLEYADSKMMNMYFGFDQSAFPYIKNSSEDFNTHTNPVKLVMHGSMDNHHLGPVLLQALKEITSKESHRVFELHFVGMVTSHLDGFMEELHDQGIPVKVVTHGFIEYNLIAKTINKAHIGLVPYEENDGSHCAFVAKAVEYAAVGLPVVATKLEGLQKYFQEIPTFKFSNFSGQSFGSMILEMCDDYPSCELIERASDKVHAELSWKNIAEKVVDFIEVVGK